jgi:hypothetical protein
MLARRLAGVSGASPEGRRPRDQLNVPGSETTGIEPGADIISPPSPQHGADSQAGAHAGAPQGSACRRQGERNSMNDCRPPPKQLLHPGAATRLPRTSDRHSARDMITFLHGGRRRRPSDRRQASSVTTPLKP